MRVAVPALALLLATGALGADRHKVEVDPESEDGILLQRIQQEPTRPRKLALLEQFVGKFPTAPALTWVYEQLLPIYKDAQEHDKVLATAGSLLALDPADLYAADDARLSAEAKNDPELIRKYAELSWDIASRAAQAPRPADPDDVADWSKGVEFANQVLAFSEYTLASQAVAEPDDDKRKELIEALKQRNPESKFLANTRKVTVIDLAKINPEKAVALAEKGLLTEPDNEDFLMTVADYDMEHEKDLPKVLSYALRILEFLPKKQKPEEVPPEEWEKKRAKFTGWASWLAGVVYGRQARYGLSDRYLRTALGYVKEDPRLLGAAYFYLGYDNYALAGELNDKGHAIEAVKFSKMCAGLDGPYRSLALKNLEMLRTEYNVE
jgi:hypothetical protein